MTSRPARLYDRMLAEVGIHHAFRPILRFEDGAVIGRLLPSPRGVAPRSHLWFPTFAYFEGGVGGVDRGGPSSREWRDLEGRPPLLLVRFHHVVPDLEIRALYGVFAGNAVTEGAERLAGIRMQHFLFTMADLSVRTVGREAEWHKLWVLRLPEDYTKAATLGNVELLNSRPIDPNEPGFTEVVTFTNRNPFIEVDEAGLRRYLDLLEKRQGRSRFLLEGWEVYRLLGENPLFLPDEEFEELYQTLTE